ncbi:MAG: HAD family phosphatase [Oscillospiraceae bacterium]
MRFAIFDLDGTLVDSMEYWRGFPKAFLEEKGYTPTSEIERIGKVNWIKWLCTYFKDEYGLITTPKEVNDWAVAYVMKQYNTIVPFKSGAKEMLEKLYNEGVQMCICSSTDRYMMEGVLKRLDMLKYFKFTEHCRQFGKEKDEPMIFHHCMEKLGAKSPQEVAVFEDAFYSASTAKSEGFYLVGMYDKTEPKQAELKALADQYVSSYEGLDYSKLPK